MNLTKDLIITSNLRSEDEVINLIAISLLGQKKVNESAPIVSALKERETQSTTNFGEGFAIAHCRNDKVVEPTLGLVKLENPIVWGENDLPKVDLVFFIVIPTAAENMHLEILGKITSKLIDKDFVEKLKTSTAVNTVKLLESAIAEKSYNEKTTIEAKDSSRTGQKIKVVGITTCPTGVAHTHMAAEALIKEAKKLGWEIKIERQASEGVINELTEQDILNADYVIIGAGKAVEKSRFIGKKLWEVPVQDPLKNAAKVLADMKANATPYSSKEAKGKGKVKSKNPVMNGILTGISYLIPVVVAGGILLSLGFGIGSAVYGVPPQEVEAHGGVWGLFITIGGIALGTIMPIVLAGFTAYGIADRAGIAPAMIVAYLMTGNAKTPVGSPAPVNNAIWDWENMKFGMEFGNLGFVGALAVGLVAGFVCLGMKKYIKLPSTMQAIVPVIMIPLFGTFIVAAIFVMFLGFPLALFAEYLDKGVRSLADQNLIFLVTIILGMMICFDLGGPVNKAAMLLGIGFIKDHPVFMAAAGAATAIPPIGMFVAHYAKKIKFLGIQYNKEDQTLANTAGILALFGITEGTIPFIVKNPKLVFANLLGGAAGGAFIGLAGPSNNAGHGGLIVYLVGAVGKNGSTDYLFGLLYVAGMLIGGLFVALGALLLDKLFVSKKAASREQVSILPV